MYLFNTKLCTSCSNKLSFQLLLMPSSCDNMLLLWVAVNKFEISLAEFKKRKIK